ncbi:MAG: hypothetical protein H7844_02180 [Nitrospirae bacterium YQR-1]
MSLKALNEDKQQGFPEPVYVLLYDDPFFEKQALSIIRDNAFSMDIYDVLETEQPFSISSISESLRMVSMFSNKTMAAIRNVQKLKAKELDVLNRYVSNPSEGSTLFLFYALPQGGGKKDDAVKFTGQFKLLKLTLPGKFALNDWIKSEGQKRGIAIEAQAVEFLKEIYGDDLQLLSNEIEKLSLLGNKNISLADTYETCLGSKDFNIFDFVGKIVRADTAGALKIMSGLGDAIDEKFNGAVNYGLCKGNAPLEAFISHLMLHINMRLNAGYPYELFVAELSRACKTAGCIKKDTKL